MAVELKLGMDELCMPRIYVDVITYPCFKFGAGYLQKPLGSSPIAHIDHIL